MKRNQPYLLLGSARIPVPFWHWTVPVELTVDSPLSPLLEALLSGVAAGLGDLFSLQAALGITEDAVVLDALMHALQADHLHYVDNTLHLTPQGQQALTEHRTRGVTLDTVEFLGRADWRLTLDGKVHRSKRWPAGQPGWAAGRLSLTPEVLQDHLNRAQSGRGARLRRFQQVNPSRRTVRLEVQAQFDPVTYLWRNVVFGPDHTVEEQLTNAMCDDADWVTTFELQPTRTDLIPLCQLDADMLIHDDALDVARELIGSATRLIVSGAAPVFSGIQQALA